MSLLRKREIEIGRIDKRINIGIFRLDIRLERLCVLIRWGKLLI